MKFKYLAITEKRLVIALVVVLALVPATRAMTVDFEDLGLPLDSFEDGENLAGSFTSASAEFNNSWTGFGGGASAWEGFAYSSMRDVTTVGFTNQFSAYVPALPGGDASPTYGVGFTQLFSLPRTQITLPAGHDPDSVRITNTTYAALSMLNGDAFTKKFGGPTGGDPDWLLLTIEGFDAVDASVGTVDFYLADYRGAVDHVISEWTTVDLSSLSGARTLGFSLASTDEFAPGILNTPAYFAMDNLELAPVPEPSGVALLATGAGMLLALGRRRAVRRSGAACAA